MGAQWKTAGKLASSTAKGKIFSKLAKEIAIAARGGADPAMNARLRAAVESAKKASMPRDTLERAITKGAGLLDETVSYETVTYEGFAPHRGAGDRRVPHRQQEPHRDQHPGPVPEGPARQHRLGVVGLHPPRHRRGDAPTTRRRRGGDEAGAQDFGPMARAAFTSTPSRPTSMR
jgi:hypothetical protein